MEGWMLEAILLGFEIEGEQLFTAVELALA